MFSFTVRFEFVGFYQTLKPSSMLTMLELIAAFLTKGILFWHEKVDAAIVVTEVTKSI